MFSIELFVPPGVLSPERRAQVAERLATAFVSHDIAAAETVEAAHAVTDVLVHEPVGWAVGQEQIQPGRPPRYLVRATVPGAWRREMSEHITSRVTQVLAELDEDPERLYREPDAVVQVVGVPEKGYGLFGRVLGSTELSEMVSTPYREARRSGTAQPPSPGMVVDPSCGAVMSLDDEETVVLELGGTTYGFCCAGCRNAYVAEQHEPAAVARD